MIPASPVSDEDYLAWIEKEMASGHFFLLELVGDVLTTCMKQKHELPALGRARTELVLRKLEEKGVEVVVERELLEHLYRAGVWPAR